jgi:hypothetical protein
MMEACIREAWIFLGLPMCPTRIEEYENRKVERSSIVEFTIVRNLQKYYNRLVEELITLKGVYP